MSISAILLLALLCSTESGSACIFPLMLEGRSRSSCVQGSNPLKKWCATAVDADGRMADDDAWDYCGDGCGGGGSDN